VGLSRSLLHGVVKGVCKAATLGCSEGIILQKMTVDLTTRSSDGLTVLTLTKGIDLLIKPDDTQLAEQAMRHCSPEFNHPLLAFLDSLLQMEDCDLSSKVRLVIRGLNQIPPGFEENAKESIRSRAIQFLFQPSLKKVQVPIIALFGGQGIPFFSELKNLFNSSNPITRVFIQDAAQALNHEIQSLSSWEKECFFPPMFDVAQYIEKVEEIPAPFDSFSSISFPLIAMVQIAHLLNFPYDPLSLASRAIGHSQGLLSALLLSNVKSREHIYLAGIETVKFAFWIGLRSHQVTSESDNLLGQAEISPMLSISGLDSQTLELTLQRVNEMISEIGIQDRESLFISLVNGPRSFVVSGRLTSLKILARGLDEIRSNPDVSQTRVPFSKRKKEFTYKFLQVSAPFHSPLLLDAVPLILYDLQRRKISPCIESLKLPVSSTLTGENILESRDRFASLSDFLVSVLNLVCIQPVDCCKVFSSELDDSVLVDFGPGVQYGVARLVTNSFNGHGFRVLSAAYRNSEFDVGGMKVLPADALSRLTISHSLTWFAQYGPRVDDQGRIQNLYTRIFHKPPVMVPGMTPCTVGEEFVSAVTHAGYRVELAGGGQHTPDIFRNRIDALSKMLSPGEGITINLLFLNPYLWNFQYPMILEMRKQGYPIEGITIAAGIPSSTKIDEIISSLVDVGITQIGFKPGSSAAILDVVNVAKRHPEMLVILQWTGGRAGGHHSYEDQFDPLLRTYSAIRACQNIILIVGGGVGDGESAFEFIYGTWSTRYGYPLMPADAVLCGSRVMASAECPTERAVKELICKASGLSKADEHLWENSYVGEAGGVLTVLSELGEPIHKIANKGTRFWRMLDTKYFSLDEANLVSALNRDKSRIISLLNSEFQKPYFCASKTMSGWKTVENLKDMTYSDVIERLCVFFHPNGRWIDITFLQRFQKFFERVCARFCPDVLNSIFKDLEPNPLQCLNMLVEKNPIVSELFLTPEDEDFFLSLCLMPGKPVNFVPIIDKNLKAWVKKDSLWYSEDLSSVPDQDADRVAILHSPVSARFSAKVDEPVREILDGIVAQLVSRVSSSIKKSHCFALDLHQTQQISSFPSLLRRFLVELPLITKFFIPSIVVRHAKSRPGYRWWKNPLPSIFEKASLFSRQSESSALICFAEDTSESSDQVRIQISEDSLQVLFLQGGNALLKLKFFCIGDTVFEEEWSLRCASIRDMYKSLWLSSSRNDSRVTVNSDDIISFQRSIGETKNLLSSGIEFSIVLCWESMISSILYEEALFSLDVLDMVHLSTSFRILGSTSHRYSPGMEALIGKFSIRDIVSQSSGICVSVEGTIEVEKVTIVVESTFCFRNPVFYGGFTLKSPSPITTEDAKPLDFPIESFSTLRAPISNLSYSLASKDHNPIHTHRGFAAFLGLPGTIVHGMHTASRVRQSLEDSFQSSCQCFKVDFSGMVLPLGQELELVHTTTALNKGRKVVQFSAKADNQTVAFGEAILSSDSCAYLFTGQGSARVNMDEPLYSSSVSAKRTWDNADAFFLRTYGFSLLNIVRKNPLSLKVSLKDPIVRKSYQDITVMQSDGTSNHLFPEALDDKAEFITFHSPSGLLFATQFQQPAILIYDRAVYQDMVDHGAFSPEACFAGHSLGEYAAISCLIPGMSIEKLAAVVFLRGLTMQSAVERDSEGRSSYGMVAVSPSRLGIMTEDDLKKLIDSIASITGELLQIVNFNIARHQYVVAGHLISLEVLRVVIDSMFYSKAPVSREHIATEASKLRNMQRSALRRGQATIPLNGIDVPFHSRMLLPGVPTFRSILESTFADIHFSREDLEERYIPNLTGTPFEVSKSYLEQLFNITDSIYLRNLLSNFGSLADSEICKRMVIEILAYQFASPVQWIQTQKCLISKGIRSFIEIGPASVLNNFFKKSFGSLLPLTLLWTGNLAHLDKLYLKQEPSESSKESSTSESVQSVVKNEEPKQLSEPLVALPKADQRFDLPVSSLLVIQCIISQKLSIEFSRISSNDTVKKLCGGKSALQNEILSEISSEFNVEPENAVDMSLAKLASACPVTGKLGRTTLNMVNKCLGSVLPGGFGVSKVREYLQTRWNACDSTVNGILLLSAVNASSMKSRLKSQSDAVSFLDKSVDAYAKYHGFDLRSLASTQASVPVPPVTSISSEDFIKLKAVLAKQRDILAAFVDCDNDVAVSDVITNDEAISLSGEFGQRFVEGIQPIFDSKKVRVYDSWWAHVIPQALRSPLTEEERNLVLNRCSDYSLDQLRHLAPTKFCDSLISAAFYRPQGCPTCPIPLGTDAVVARYANGYEGLIQDLLIDAEPCSRVTLRYFDGSDGSDSCEDAFRASVYGILRSGISHEHKIVLITGCGRGSIGLEVAKAFLQSGATVVVTTSSPSRSRWNMFREVYSRYAGKNAILHVIPFNGASKQDVRALVEYLASKNLIPDFIFPFAAISEAGRDLTNIDDVSELAHRCLLTNVERLIGAFYEKLAHQSSFKLSKLHVYLPLSPNHGILGNDGLYGESKLGLEILFRKWKSESWGSMISLIGIVIGWTRGTGLMTQNDDIAYYVEDKLGLRTFSGEEIAFFSLGLTNPSILDASSKKPLLLDVSGGFSSLADSFAQRLNHIRLQLQDQKKSLKPSIESSALELPHLSTFCLSFPDLPRSLEHSVLRDMIDLKQTIVVVGYGEVGPWGSARTRWEWECMQQFSTEGATELARSMGLIKYVSTVKKSGWVDSLSGEFVADDEIALKYFNVIVSKCGIRPITEPQNFDNYDPLKKFILQEVALESDMEPFEVASEEEAEYLRARHSANILIEREKDGRLVAKLKKGCSIYVPKSVPFSRFVAGQLPSGWNGTHYGLPEDIIKQTDPVTIYALCATMDAFLSAGITDPYELYQHVHVSEVGNSIGGGMGGMKSIRDMFRNRVFDLQGIASDVLQESFINTTAAWINMLLTSSCGPIKTPVAACATAATSIDIACETILSGKAQVMIAGGTEDFGEEGSFEFAQLKATSDATVETSSGREPDEHCRPAASTRNGFMESQGAGVQILVTADLAIKMGLPIYAVIGMTRTASDRQGRSVPAPGQGILSSCREIDWGNLDPYKEHRLLSVDYRGMMLQKEIEIVKLNYANQLQSLQELASRSDSNAIQSRISTLKNEMDRRVDSLKKFWSHEFFVGDSTISPFRGSLAVWGLNIDDVQVCSFHGTGTQANDVNESEVVAKQMRFLKRTRGNPLFTIWQKWCTGHPKGAAAAWMLNGLIQSMLSGKIPGNRNMDNTDAKLQQFSDVLVYSDRTINLGKPIKAGYLHSFGFGQAGAEIILIHPDQLWQAIDSSTYESYCNRRHSRWQSATRHYQESMLGLHPWIAIKDDAPYVKQDETSTFFNPTARASYDLQREAWKISLTSAQSAVQQTPGLGIDLENIQMFVNKSESFLSRNFTPEEISCCVQSPHPPSSFAGRWCAKEAVIKAICSLFPNKSKLFQHAGAPLRDIEILPSDSGAPQVRFHDQALTIIKTLGVSEVKVSISHTDEHALAQAHAYKH
jgi:phosphopantetheine--protein transferase-like protein